MNMLRNCIIVGGLHGDEPTGIAVAEHFIEHPYPGIRAIVANPQAIAQNKRFVETDMNRSFAPKIPVSYEEQRAAYIKEQLGEYDLLIDIHNTKGDFTTCAITTMEPTVLHTGLATYFGMSRLVVMPPSGSLLALMPEKSVSLEIALNETKRFPKKQLIEKIKQLAHARLAREQEHITKYIYVQSIKTNTVKRLGIHPEELTNFVTFSHEQQTLLQLPSEKEYCPMFAKKPFSKDVAFELLEKVS